MRRVHWFFLPAVLLLLLAVVFGGWSLFNAGRQTKVATSNDSPRMPIYRKMFPDLSEVDIDNIFGVVYRQVHAPWVGFRNADINTRLVNHQGFVRTTVPDTSGDPNAATELFFFGGSTMAGVHVPDDRTLPAAFVQHAAQSGAAFRVVNFGQPYYYLKQEAMLFLSMLIDGRSPQVAVFLDGLNEVLGRGSVYARTPFFFKAYEYVIAQASDSPTVWQKLRGVLSGRRIPSDLIASGFHLPDGVEPQIVYQRIGAAYVSNVRRLMKACEANGIICLFFLQPVPFMSYDRARDPFADKREFPQFKPVYDLIKNELRGVQSFQAIDDAFLDSSDIAYVDAFHYSPYGNNVLAKRIFAKVQEGLVAAQ